MMDENKNSLEETEQMGNQESDAGAGSAETTSPIGENETDLSLDSNLESSEPIIAEKLFEQAQTTASEKKKGKKVIQGIVITLGILLVAAYLTMTWFCRDHFAPKTIINGKDYTWQRIEEVNADITSCYANYQLDITYRDGITSILAKDVLWSVDATDDLTKIMDSQNPFLWFYAKDRDSYTADVVVNYDVNKCMDVLDNISYTQKDNMILPHNPEILYKEGAFYAEKTEPGTLMDIENYREKVMDALYNIKDSLDCDAEGLYEEAEFNEESAEVVKAVERANYFLSSKINYVIGSITVPIEADDIKDMLVIGKDYSVTLSKDKVAAYVVKTAETYDTYGTAREFRTHDNKKIEVTGKYYGWQMDQELETQNLFEDLVNARTIDRAPAFLNTGWDYTKDRSDIGNSYAEVDLTNQHVYLFIDGNQVFDCDCVTGNVSANHTTPGGLYYLKYKMRDVVLRGPDYASPVSYWMPFNGGIGFHDANWRSKFGGNIYMTGGSHGCVNMPPSRTGDFYDQIEAGMPVVCYWR